MSARLPGPRAIFTALVLRLPLRADRARRGELVQRRPAAARAGAASRCDWYSEAFDDERRAAATSGRASRSPIASTAISLVARRHRPRSGRAAPRGAGARVVRRDDLLADHPARGRARARPVPAVRAGSTSGWESWTIVIGHVVFNSAYATIIIQARFATLTGTLEEAAADLGATPLARVPARDAAAAACRRSSSPGLLVFTFSFDNVITSQFLGGDRAQTLPVLVLGLIRLSA